jgi:hypothetical protein
MTNYHQYFVKRKAVLELLFKLLLRKLVPGSLGSVIGLKHIVAVAYESHYEAGSVCERCLAACTANRSTTLINYSVTIPSTVLRQIEPAKFDALRKAHRPLVGRASGMFENLNP